MIQRFLILFLFAGIFTFLTSSPVLSEEVSDSGVTVFIYHHFGRPEYPTTNVSVQRFAEQMAYLAKEGYQVVPLSQVVAALHGDGRLPEKAVVITIDDGYRTIYDKAWPILKKHDFPFTVFLYGEGIVKKFSNYLTWEQVKEMQQAGVDFQDHSFSHHRLARKPNGMDEEQYRKWIRDDLAENSALLKEHLGYLPDILALPYGEYNNTVLDEAKKLGYKAILTQDAGSVSKDTDPFLITREPILGDDWSTMGHFKMILDRVDLPLKEMEPPIEPLVEKNVKRFGARILYPERYRSGSLGIYVSELGWQQGTLDGDFLYIENSTPLTREQNRVAVSGREKESGRMAIRFWLLIGEEAN